MLNSYGVGPHATTLFGQPVTLTRLITQNNISTSSGNPYAQAAGSIGRVQMYARLDEACSEVEMPAFTSTYSDRNATRGYFFQTPVAINITGLQVPDETSNGTQNVEVFNLGATPPISPATGQGTSVFYAAGMPSNQVIPTNLYFAPGDWIGVLGACGTTTMYSSYAPASPTDILGHTVELRRLVTQTNLNAGGNQIYTGFAAGISSIGRVHMHLSQAPVGVDYGVATDAGSGTPTLTTCVLPSIGRDSPNRLPDASRRRSTNQLGNPQRPGACQLQHLDLPGHHSHACFRRRLQCHERHRVADRSLTEPSDSRPVRAG